jgi:hypothetical protein
MIDRIARVWSGSDWEVITSNAAASTAVVNYQSDAPSSPVTGQVWVDTSTNQFNVWDGSAWIAAITTYNYQLTAPTNPTVGQVWVDSTDNLFYIWDGDSWIQTQTLSSYQEEEPEEPEVGQIWIRSTDRQNFVYDGLSGWRRVRDNSPIKFNYDTLDEDTFIAEDRNAFSVGPISILEEVTVTLDEDCIWCIL